MGANAGRSGLGSARYGGAGLAEVVGGEVGDLTESRKQRFAFGAGEQFAFGYAIGGKDVPGEKEPALAGIVAEGAEVADQGVRDAEMPGSVAGFDLLAAVEDHRRQLVEHRHGFAGIALKARGIRHRVLVEVEATGGEQAQQRHGGQVVAAMASSRAAASGFCRTLPWPSPLRPSTHHCRRISPAAGSRARSRIEATSALKA